MGFKLFISYSKEDFEIVKHIKGMLSHPLIETFVAEHSVIPGESLAKTIYASIKRCVLFILIWSMNSEESEWVAREIELARSEDKVIVPIKLDENSKLPGILSDIKYLSFYQNPEKVINWIQSNVFGSAQAKSWEPVIWLLIGAALFWLLTQK